MALGSESPRESKRSLMRWQSLRGWNMVTFWRRYWAHSARRSSSALSLSHRDVRKRPRSDSAISLKTSDAPYRTHLRRSDLGAPSDCNLASNERGPIPRVGASMADPRGREGIAADYQRARDRRDQEAMRRH